MLWLGRKSVKPYQHWHVDAVGAIFLTGLCTKANTPGAAEIILLTLNRRWADQVPCCYLITMKSFSIEAEIAGKIESLLLIPDKLNCDITFRIIKDGVEFCTLSKNGEMGWQVNGTPLNADELESIGRQIKAHSS